MTADGHAGAGFLRNINDSSKIRISMSDKIEIKIVIDSALVKYFEEGMRKRSIDESVTEEVTEFLAAVLNDSIYPIVSIKTDNQEIHLNYRPKSFADPIF